VHGRILLDSGNGLGFFRNGIHFGRELLFAFEVQHGLRFHAGPRFRWGAHFGQADGRREFS
jgi:hypothetical protein